MIVLIPYPIPEIIPSTILSIDIDYVIIYPFDHFWQLLSYISFIRKRDHIWVMFLSYNEHYNQSSQLDGHVKH